MPAKNLILLTCNRTKKHAGPGPAGVLHGNAGILQCPVDALKELLLLRVHLFHLAIADAEKPVVEFVEPVQQINIFQKSIAVAYHLDPRLRTHQ